MTNARDDENLLRGSGSLPDGNLALDDELAELFSAFDEVSAPEELQQAALARIFATEETDRRADAAKSNSLAANLMGIAADNAPDQAAEACITIAAPACADASSTACQTPLGAPEPATVIPVSAPNSPAKPKTLASSGKTSMRARLRTIRVFALAACLALALAGGAAYAVPATYYEVEQGDCTITLGVNLFGITVSAVANNSAVQQAIDAAGMLHAPYERSLEQAVETMEELDPTQPIEYGPRGGEREWIAPAGEPASAQPDAQPSAAAENAEGEGGDRGAYGGQPSDRAILNEPGVDGETMPSDNPKDQLNGVNDEERNAMPQVDASQGAPALGANRQPDGGQNSGSPGQSDDANPGADTPQVPGASEPESQR